MRAVNRLNGSCPDIFGSHSISIFAHVVDITCSRVLYKRAKSRSCIQRDLYMPASCGFLRCTAWKVNWSWGPDLVFHQMLLSMLTSLPSSTPKA